MLILYFPQQTNTCSKSATKTLEITEEIQMKTYSKNNHRMCSIKKVFLFNKIHRKTPVPEPLFQVASLRPVTLLRDSAKGVFL